MSKFDLGKRKSNITNINKTDLYINSNKLKTIDKNVQNDLEKMRTSLMNISSLLNKAAKNEFVKGKRVEIFKGWAKVSKSQALSCEKLKYNFNDRYKDDLQKYILKLLDERITDIEKRIDALANQ